MSAYYDDYDEDRKAKELADAQRRVEQLEAENQRLKKIVAQQVLDIDALKDLAGKEW